MSKKKDPVRVIMGIAGAALFFGFLYLLPFGTDGYLYLWVELIYHGDWFHGVIAANVAALLGMAAGLLLMLKAGRTPTPAKRKQKKKSEGER